MKSILIIGIVVLAFSLILVFSIILASLNVHDVDGVEIPNLSVKPQSDFSLKDILPIQPTSNGDIPIFVQLLRDAKETKNISLCDTLPEPQEQRFDFGDYSNTSPNQSSWVSYCRALVTENPLECPTTTSSHPNLSQECHFILD